MVLALKRTFMPSLVAHRVRLSQAEGSRPLVPLAELLILQS